MSAIKKMTGLSKEKTGWFREGISIWSMPRKVILLLVIFLGLIKEKSPVDFVVRWIPTVYNLSFACVGQKWTSSWCTRVPYQRPFLPGPSQNGCW